MKHLMLLVLMLLSPLASCAQQHVAYAYDASGNRVCMSTPKIVKYYLDEYEVSEDGRLQIMYLGSDAYTAPMAYMLMCRCRTARRTSTDTATA